MSKPKPPVGDPAHDVLGYEREPLDAIFGPETVAVIGATDRPGSVGRTIMWNLVSNPFGGTIFPVNSHRSSVLGVKAYPSLAEVPGQVDLAVIVAPAPSVPGIIEECVEEGVAAAIIISAGFRETGPEGAALEERVLQLARRGRMRLMGPNCLGVMSPVTGLNATFAGAMANPGNVAFLSQSGALLTAILDWSFRENVGFSHFVSMGSMLDVDWGDLIQYLGDDRKTKSILAYMESIGDARSFLSAAREVAMTKPIIVIKAGRTEAAGKAAQSHTGSLTGSDEVLDAAFRRSGVLRVDRISDLFYMAEVLGRQPRPKGPRLTVVTNAGGPGVLATDALIREGGELAQVSPETMEELNGFLPAPWSHANPIDVLGDATPERYEKTLAAASKDRNSDGLLVVLTPQDMTDPTGTAEGLASYTGAKGKPVLASWMGGPDVAPGVEILNRAGIPTFDYPDAAARVFANMWRYAYNLRAIYETPELADEDQDGGPHHDRAEEIIDAARDEKRTILTEFESKEVLAAYGIPTVETEVARSAEEAVRAAGAIGYPVALKLDSKTVTHKTDVGGVKLDLPDAEAVREAYGQIESSVREKAGERHFDGVTVQPMERLDGYELILGSSVDPQFGPVLLFGSGGQLVEVYRDRALALPPLTTTLARRTMEQTRIYEALKGVRGREPVDLGSLERLLVRFSQLVVEQPMIRELDINPLLASAQRLVALDARIVLHDPETRDLPEPAIRPYPNQYVSRAELTDGTPITVRPIRPEDEPLMVEFHEGLSEQSVYMRYFHMLNLDQRTAHERLTRICFIDYDREMALVAESRDPETGRREVLGVGRLSRDRAAPEEAEFSVLVSDRHQRRGLGTILLDRLLEVGKAEGLSRITADILSDNRPMQAVSRNAGFDLRYDPEEGVVKANLDLERSEIGSRQDSA